MSWTVGQDWNPLAMLGEIKTELVDELERTVPVRSGATRDSIDGQVNDDGVTVTIGGAATLIESGTSPHEITGHPWLYWEGAEHPVRVVHHPGTEPNPFAERALETIDEYYFGHLLDSFAASITIEGTIP